MKSIIATQRVQKGSEATKDCVHFGFCTAVCPTYVLDGEEKDSPRGRIALIKEMLEKGGKPTAETITHVDRCLSCLSCATTCAAGVDYRTIIDTGREYIEASGARSVSDRWTRRLLADVLTTPWLLRSLLRISGPLLPLASRLPGTVGALGRIAQAGGQRFVATSAADDLGPVPKTSSSRRVALLEGCAQSVIGTEINRATQRLLHRLGVDVVDCGTDGQCCGAMNLHMGHASKAARQAAALVDAWGDKLASGEIDAIVTTTSGCGSVIRHYRELFEGDPQRQATAQRIEKACMDISEFLKDFDLPLSSSHRGAKVAYHDSCSLKHGSGITREPRALLRRAGFVVADIAESHLCCGSAGTYNILQPSIAERLGKRKAGNIAATDPDVFTAANMGCLVQISMYMDKPGAHVAQLLDWATGGPPPAGLETFTAPAPSAEASRAPAVHEATPLPATETSDLLW